MRKRLSFLLAAATTAVAATMIPTASVSVTAQPPALHWGACPQEVAGPVLQCATLGVPLDYRDPGGQQIDIMISRMASKNPDKRRGTLFLNAGGPGIAALDYGVVLASTGLPQEILDAYDVISFDPRGIGHSTPVTCNFTPEQLKRGVLPAYSHTAADVEQEAGFARTVAEQCASSPTSWLLPHISTANTARDMDRIREALGQEQVSYLGPSYGTYLGAVYTTMFPERTDRVVLDSSLPSVGYDIGFMRGFGRGTEERFPDFEAFAAAHPEHELGTTPAEVRSKYFGLTARLEQAPIRGVDANMFRDTMFQLLYMDVTLPQLAEYMHALDTDQPLPTIPPIPGLENAMSGRLAVICGDRSWPKSVRVYQQNAEVDRERYPVLGGATGNIPPCAFWPVEPVEPPVQITDQGPANVLIVQYARDPGTPLVGAQDMRRAFGNRARLVTVDQGGHVVVPFSGNTCAIGTTTSFLVGGERPAQDIACVS